MQIGEIRYAFAPCSAIGFFDREEAVIRWLKWWTGVRFMSRDAHKTLNDLRGLSTEKQSVVATALMKEMSRILAELESNADPRHQFQVWTDSVQRAKLQRHAALLRGAQSAQHPDWAVAALVESWAFLMSAGISAGHKAGLTLQREMLEWAAPLISSK